VYVIWQEEFQTMVKEEYEKRGSVYPPVSEEAPKVDDKTAGAKPSDKPVAAKNSRTHSTMNAKSNSPSPTLANSKPSPAGTPRSSDTPGTKAKTVPARPTSQTKSSTAPSSSTRVPSSTAPGPGVTSAAPKPGVSNTGKTALRASVSSTSKPASRPGVPNTKLAKPGTAGTKAASSVQNKTQK